MDLAALKTEIQLPAYAGKSDVEITDMLSVVMPAKANREALSAGDLVASIVRSEYAALTAGDKQYVQLIAMAQTMPLTATLKTELGAVFPSGSTTRTNLLALLKRPGTRAEELGLGVVTPSDVANARRA